MAILIDSQVWLWMQSSDERLSPQAMRSLASPDVAIQLSSVSIAEVGIKYSIGKLGLDVSVSDMVAASMADFGLDLLSFRAAHAEVSADLPLHHVDPFDRMLTAQAMIEPVPILTSDRWFELYDVEVIAAV